MRNTHMIGNYYNPITYKNGEGLNDCDSAILCRRGLLRRVRGFFNSLKFCNLGSFMNSWGCSLNQPHQIASLYLFREMIMPRYSFAHTCHFTCKPWTCFCSNDRNSGFRYLSDSPSPSRSTNHNQAPRNLNPISEHKPFIWSYIGDGALSMKSCGGFVFPKIANFSFFQTKMRFCQVLRWVTYLLKRWYPFIYQCLHVIKS